MWFLALRHLTARKRQTLVTLMGVGLGVAAFISFTSIMLGFQNYIIDQLVNNDAHVRISAREEPVNVKQLSASFFPNGEHPFWIVPPSGRRDNSKIQDPLSWFRKLDRDNRVLAYSPQMKTQAIFSKGSLTRAGSIIGSQPDKQVKISNIRNYIVQGSFESLSRGGNRVVMGTGLADRLGLRLGDTVSISTGKSDAIPFKVSGLFQFGINNIDDSVGFTNLTDAQAVNLTPSLVTDIGIRLVDVQYARDFAKDLSFFSQDKVLSWDQSSANILSVFTLQDVIRIFISAVIMIVAAFGIYNILSILVNQKRKDIGILRSIGFDRKDIIRLFAIQGFILGVIGGVMGLVLGFLLSWGMTLIQFQGGMMNKMIVAFQLDTYVIGFVAAVISSLISSALPARSAGKLEPIEIVRSGDSG